MHARYYWTLAAVLLLGARHPTPTVVLAKQTDVIRSTLPDARQFFLRKVTVGKEDLAKIRKEVDYSPEDPDVSFYLGKDGGGKTEGVVLFPQVNTMHGPVEVGLTLDPDGTIENAVVTKATVETKPWVQEAVSAGLLRQFKGMKHGDDVNKALKQLPAGKLGQMPYWEAEVITAAVRQGLVLHNVLFKDASRA
ncbi:MAG TPA: hypothetical protein VIM84_15375 [Gemmatimonadales bacterium]